MSSQPPKLPPQKQSSTDVAVTTLCAILGAGVFLILNQVTDGKVPGGVIGGAIGGAIGGVLGGLAASAINSVRKK